MSRGLGRTQRAVLDAAQAAADPETGWFQWVSVDEVLPNTIPSTLSDWDQKWIADRVADMTAAEMDEEQVADWVDGYGNRARIGSHEAHDAAPSHSQREAVRRAMRTLFEKDLVELATVYRERPALDRYGRVEAVRRNVLAVRMPASLEQRAGQARKHADDLMQSGIAAIGTKEVREMLQRAEAEAKSLETELAAQQKAS